jgi:hypothetical protein
VYQVSIEPFAMQAASIVKATRFFVAKRGEMRRVVHESGKGLAG